LHGISIDWRDESWNANDSIRVKYALNSNEIDWICWWFSQHFAGKTGIDWGLHLRENITSLGLKANTCWTEPLSTTYCRTQNYVIVFVVLCSDIFKYASRIERKAKPFDWNSR
jgi:hypothetical protein